MALTLKQRLFIQEYLLTNGNATQAALVAYDVKNRNTASQIGHENLRKPEVKLEIENALAKNHIDLDWCLSGLRKIIETGSQLKDVSTQDMLFALELYFRVKGKL